MVDSILLTFLTPELSISVHGILQIGFALVFVSVLFVAPSLVTRAARSDQWQYRLDRIDKADDQVATYTTPEELSGAVATPAERWADLLPSLVLVFGLLGTFIGLGLALTEAADVLGNGQHLGSNPLDNLTPIMSSLGSKFKTSTWGIVAFLGLKVWFMLHPYEERRLAWAAQKVKARAAQIALQAQQHEAGERQRLIDTIVQSSSAMLSGQRSALADAHQRHESTVALHQQLAAQQHQASLAALQENGLQLVAAIGQSSAAQLEAQQRTATRAETRHKLLVDAQQLYSSRQIEAIEQASAATLLEQQRAIQQTADQYTGTIAALTLMSEQQAHATAQLAERADQQILRLDQVSEHTTASRIAMEGFVHSVQDNIGTMANAANNMAHAADAAGKASADLGAVINDFRSTMTVVLGDIKSGLGESINTMQSNFGANMSDMSDSLARATTGIETAISHLSSSVNETIDTLKQANQESISLQVKAQSRFAASGDSLMESLQSMQAYVQQMQTKIEAGLRSVSEAGLKITHATSTMGDLLNASTASNQRAAALVSTIDSVTNDIRQLVAGMTGQQQSRIAVQAQIAELGANVSQLLSTQQQALQHDGNRQLLDTLERASEAWAQPARLDNESIERLLAAFDQPTSVADESIERLANALSQRTRAVDETPA